MGFLSIIKSILGKGKDSTESGAVELLHDLEEKGLSHDEAKETVVYMFMKESKKLKNKKAVEQKAHDNETIAKEDALRKLIMISLLMYKIDGRIITD